MKIKIDNSRDEGRSVCVGWQQQKKTKTVLFWSQKIWQWKQSFESLLKNEEAESAGNKEEEEVAAIL